MKIPEKQNKVLIIEESKEIFNSVLSDSEYIKNSSPILISASAKTALNKITEYEPDLVLLDLGLKGKLSGMNLYNVISELYDKPLIFITDQSDANTLRLLENSHVKPPYFYIFKPFVDADVINVFSNTLISNERFILHKEPKSFDGTANVLNKEIFNTDVYKRLSSKQKFTLFYIDMDRFELINHSLGYENGTFVLKEIAHMLRNCMSEGDKLYRVSGDHFAIIVDGNLEKDEVEDQVKRIYSTLLNSVVVDKFNIRLSPSIAVMTLPKEDIESIEDVFSAITNVINEIKKKGGDDYKFLHKKNVYKRYLDKLRIELDMINALDKDEFEVFYQPKLNVSTKEIVGLEALLRWENSRLGSVDPEKFIRIAHETGYIDTISQWVIKQVCTEISTFSPSIGENGRVSVNLPSKLFNEDLISNLETIFNQTNFNPKNLELEITDPIEKGKMSYMIRILNILSNMGISISIDDFASKSYSIVELSALPISSIKIEANVVNKMDIDDCSRNIVKGIIDLSHNFSMTVIAEGVERDIHVEMLEDMGCDVMQGFFISYPLPNEIIKILEPIKYNLI